MKIKLHTLLLGASILGVAASTAQADTLLQVLVTNPSSVKLIATENKPSWNPFLMQSDSGFTLMDFFTSDTSYRIPVTASGTLTAPAYPMSGAFNYVIPNNYTPSYGNGRHLTVWQDPRSLMQFASGTRAFSGEMSVDLSMWSSLLTTTEGYIGEIRPGNGNIQGASMGQYEIIVSAATTTGDVTPTPSPNPTVGNWNVGGSIIIGDTGTGSLQLKNYVTVTSTTAHIGNQAGSTGTVTVNSSSTWTNTGDLYVGETGAGTLTVANSSTVAVTGMLNLATNSGSTGTLNFGAYDGTSAAGTLSATGVAFGAGAGVINFNQTNALTISALISGAGTVNQRGTGTTTLSGANTYTGATNILSGTLALGTATALQNSTATLSGGTLSFGSLTAATFGGLAGSTGLALTNNTPAAVALTAGGNNASTTYSGVLSGTGSLTKAGTGALTLTGANTYTGGTTVSAGTLIGSTDSLQGDITNNAAVTFEQATAGTYSGVLSGTGSLTKTGTGTTTLSGANTYTGATTVSAGTLVLGASGALASSAINVATGATFDVSAVSGGFTLGSAQILGGDGTVAGLLTVDSGAHLGPGSSPGTLTFTSGLTLNAGAILDFELGTTSDLIRVSGGTLTGPSSGTVTLNLSDSGGFAAGTYTLFDYTSATLGDFNTADFQLGTSMSGYTYSFGFSGSTLQLTAAAVPEPAATALLLGLLATGTLFCHRLYRRRTGGV